MFYMQRLDKKSIYIFFYRWVVFWMVCIGFFILCTILHSWDTGEGESFKDNLRDILDSLSVVDALIWVIIVLAFVIVGIVWAVLTYHFYKYELSASGFRKESGIIFKKYVTIPYGRIQNVNIHRSIPDRIFSLSDVHIQTAGYSNYGSSRNNKYESEGRLPGVSHEVALKLRKDLIKRAVKEDDIPGGL